MTEVTERFRSRVGGLALLPEILAQACVEVLGVAGAGISMTMDELRVPLGASDEMAARAEILQTTVGEGPCLSVTATSRPLVADTDLMSQRWPMFYSEVSAQTPFRCIASLPIRSPELPAFGALDLYSTDSYQVSVLSLEEIGAEIADQIATLLFEAPNAGFDQGITMPIWLGSTSVTSRMNVWVAVGMLMEHSSVSNTDALAALRAYAFGHDTTLDEVATQLSSEKLQPQSVLA